MISRFFYLAILFLSLYIQIFSVENPDLVIQTTTLGAELTSIKYKGKEYLHDGKTFLEPT